MDSSTSRVRGQKNKRPPRSDKDCPNRKSKKRKTRVSSASETFPLTHDGIEFLVRGLAFAPSDDNCQNVTSRDVKGQTNDIDEKIDGSHDNSNNCNHGTVDDDKIVRDLQLRNVSSLVLKLRVDEVATAITTKSIEHAASSSMPLLLGTVCDGKQSVRVLLLNSTGELSKRLIREKGRKKKYDWTISVRGYTSTDTTWNPNHELFPIICLTSVSVLSYTKRKGTLSSPYTVQKLSSYRARAGSIASFLSNKANFLTTEELAGSSKLDWDHFLTLRPSPVVRSPSCHPEKDASDIVDINGGAARGLFQKSSDSNLKRCQQFLSFTMAMTALKLTTASSSPSSTGLEATPTATLFSPTKLPTEHATDLYSKTLEEFIASQKDRQNASLGTNAGRENAERAARVSRQHNYVLGMAIRETKPLSVQMICGWHKELLKDIHPEAGIIRTRTVRCGQTVFCPAPRILFEMEAFCTGLLSLAERIDVNNALHIILYASVAMYGIIDIHPFLDGNGRLSRIVANYALKSLPFPINIFATQAQRSEYVLAIERTRHHLSLSGKGTVYSNEELEVVRKTGVFHSLVELLLDRVAKAVVQCRKVWDEKQFLAAEAAEARAARRAREQASQGTCIICFENRPNIATLCCGKAIHLNCIAEWLSGQTTCPNCRSEMPAISGRVVRAARRSVRNDSEDAEAETASEVLEVARQQLQGAREARVLLARIYDQVLQRDGGGHDSSDTSSLLSSPSDIEETTTTTIDEEESDETASPRDNMVSSNETEEDGVAGTSEEDNTANVDSRSQVAHNRRIGTTTESAGDTTDDERRNFGDNSESSVDAGDTTTTSEVHVDVSNPESPSQVYDTTRQGLSFCLADRCRNRAAVDCANALCGRCCVLAGAYHCPRHNS